MDWYIGTEWTMDRKGLRKIVLNLQFTKMQKPTEVARTIIKIKQFENIAKKTLRFHNHDGKSKYLSEDKLNKSLELEMGTASTPIDYYLEILVQQMLLGEEAQCFINTSSGEVISIIIELEEILQAREIQTLTVKEMFERAQLFKENGVKMFKEYPRFAHDYFVRAAKCLISYKPFKNLTEDNDGVSANDMDQLLINIQTNIAACLLAEKRYEDVIYQTNFVETQVTPSEKSIYRRAMAFYFIKEFEKAQKTIEKFPNHQEKREFLKLQERIAQSSKKSHDQYKNVMQRMFS